MASTASSAPAQRLDSIQRHLAASAKPPRPSPPLASSFRYFLPFQTRWADNDQYGHLNNVKYGEYFDSITNHYLRHHCYPALDQPDKHPIGLVVASHTSYASSLAYPEPVLAGLAVARLGTSSVEWRVALFAAEYAPAVELGGLEGWEAGDAAGAEGAGRRVRLKLDGKGEARAAAWGGMTHVFVDERSRKPVKGLESGMRAALERLLVEEAGDGLAAA
ncbi:hypothetical protein JCM10213v2_007486 [Rhodosporidiobolus nylandii]